MLQAISKPVESRFVWESSLDQHRDENHGYLPQGERLGFTAQLFIALLKLQQHHGDEEGAGQTIQGTVKWPEGFQGRCVSKTVAPATLGHVPRAVFLPVPASAAAQGAFPLAKRQGN